MPLTKPIPPTPPTIDKGEATDSTPRIDAHEFFNIPFKHETEKPAPKVETPAQTEKPVSTETPPPQSEKTLTTPEDMARDAVANGAGALTKKTITRPDAETVTPAQNSPQNNLPATANIPSERQSRGKEILREFQNEDREISQNVETPRNFNVQQNESYSGFYWIVMLIFVGVFSIVFVRKVLVKKNPALKKSDLFEDADKRLQAVSEKVTAPQIKPVEKIPAPKVKPVEKVATKKSPPKNDDDKVKHFEIRV